MDTPSKNTTSKKTTRRTDPHFRWIRKVTSGLDYGTLWTNSKGQTHPIHCNRLEDIIGRLEGRPTRAYGFTNPLLMRHCANEDTFYFTGTSYGTDHTLVMLDIDVQKKLGIGTPAGALDCIQFLKKKLFKNLYYEPSTNKKGQHGYFLLETKGKTDLEIKAALKQLEKTLKTYIPLFDIEDIEIKGHPGVVHWSTHRRGKVDNFTFGILAKVPRDYERFHELEATTRMTCADLTNIPEHTGRAPLPLRGKGAISIKSSVSASKSSSKSPVTASKKVSGSISQKHIEPKRLASTKAFILKHFKSLPTHKKYKITVDHVATCLTILEHCSRNMNKDGTLPRVRIERMWKGLFEAGDVEHDWHKDIYTTVKNWLRDCGCLEIVDSKYWFFPQSSDPDVPRKVGRAMKWSICSELLSMLEEEREEKEERHPCVFPISLSNPLTTQWIGIEPQRVPPDYEIRCEGEEVLRLYATGWSLAA